MMAKDVKFVLNRRAFREQILLGKGVNMESALRNALPGDDVQVTAVGTRMRARVFGRMRDEQGGGSLSRRLGGGQ